MPRRWPWPCPGWKKSRQKKRSLRKNPRQRKIDILPAASGEDSYGLSVCFPEMASVGSSHNRPTSAEDHEEALLLGCPPIGRSDREYRAVREEKKEGSYILGLKTPSRYGPHG